MEGKTFPKTYTLQVAPCRPPFSTNRKPPRAFEVRAVGKSRTLVARGQWSLVVHKAKQAGCVCIRPVDFNGASDRARTGDPRFTRAVLCQLSYAGDSMTERTEPFRRLTIVRGNAAPRKHLIPSAEKLFAPTPSLPPKREPQSPQATGAGMSQFAPIPNWEQL